MEGIARLAEDLEVHVASVNGPSRRQRRLPCDRGPNNRILEELLSFRDISRENAASDTSNRKRSGCTVVRLSASEKRLKGVYVLFSFIAYKRTCMYRSTVKIAYDKIAPCK